MLQSAKGTESSTDTLSRVGKIAISSHLRVQNIDMALLLDDFESLMQINKVDSLMLF